MISNNIKSKIRRELYKLLSRVCLKELTTNYDGLKLKVPIIQGQGTGFLVSSDKLMSDCLSVFLKLKTGAVIDIGVNIGLYIVKLRSLELKREYIGFEPNPVCNNYTAELIRANGFNNINVYPYALSNTKELRTFYTRRKADKMGSLNDYARFGEINKSEIKLITFPADEVIELLSIDEICIVKIDVEGSELEVLQGLVGSIDRFKPFLYCEIWQLPERSHPTFKNKHEKTKNIFKLMAGLDYKILGFSAKDNKRIEIIDRVDMLSDNYRRDYVMAHISDVDQLIESLVSSQ